MSIHLSKPHFIVVLDDDGGDISRVIEGEDGEVYCMMHPAAAEADTPARFNGHVGFGKAAEIAIRHWQDRNPPEAAS